MKKYIKQASIIAVMLFAIILKISVLFFMSKNIVSDKRFIFHEWMNFFFICIFFTYIFEKIEVHMENFAHKLLVIVGFSVSSFLIVIFEKSIIEYNRFPQEYSQGCEMIYGLCNSFTQRTKDCLWLCLGFALFTLLLCAFNFVLSRSKSRDWPTSSNTQMVLKMMLVIDICVKTALRFFPSLETVNYIVNGTLFFLLFAILNRTYKKIQYKMIFACLVSFAFLFNIMEESFVFLCNSNIEDFKNRSFNYKSAFWLFFALCVVHILMKKYGTFEKMKFALKKLSNHFIIDDTIYEIAFNVEDKSISGKLKEISSVKIGNDTVIAGLFTYDDGHQEYVCFKNAGAYKNKLLSISNDQQRVLKEYGRQIIFFYDKLENANINGDFNDGL